MEYHTLLHTACNGRSLVLIQGPPCGGKGIRSDVAHAALSNLSSNRIGRYDMSSVVDGHIERKTRLGNIFSHHKNSRDKGKLLPDEPIVEALAADISVGLHGTAIIVGFPRNSWQADVLVRSQVPFKVIELVPSGDMIHLNRESRQTESRTDNKSLDVRISDYDRDSPKYRGRLRDNATTFITLRTSRQYLRRDVVAIIGACIGRTHPEWKNIMSSLDDPNSAPGRILLPAMKKDRERLALAA